jgi:hypothetical protein
MDKLQHLLDTGFGQPAAHRATQQPNEWAIERDRKLEQLAKKIEALRRARLAHQTPTVD